MLSHEDLQELGLHSDETHLESVKRYSEFTQLHQQLLRSPQLAKQTQGRSVGRLVDLSVIPLWPYSVFFQ